MGKVRKTMTIENVAQKTQLLLKQATLEYEEKIFLLFVRLLKYFQMFGKTVRELLCQLRSRNTAWKTQLLIEQKTFECQEKTFWDICTSLKPFTYVQETCMSTYM